MQAGFFWDAPSSRCVPRVSNQPPREANLLRTVFSARPSHFQELDKALCRNEFDLIRFAKEFFKYSRDSQGLVKFQDMAPRRTGQKAPFQGTLANRDQAGVRSNFP